MHTARERFEALKRSSRKKSFFGETRFILVIVVLVVLALVYAAPRSDIRGVMTSALSKQNQGIILNYFDMTPESAVQVLGEPESSQPYREGDQLVYWKFDPVTLELYYHQGRVSRIAYETSNKLILDHIEGRALKVYGSEENWMQRRRFVDGEDKVVFLNELSRMTVVKYDQAVMVYNYLFPLQPAKRGFEKLEPTD